MALKAVVESLDGIDESVQSFYKEKDGKFYLKVEGIKTEDVSGLKSALQKERDARKSYEDQIKQLNAKFENVDIEAYQKMINDKKKAEETKLTEAGEFEKLKDKWRKERDQERQDLKAVHEKELNDLKGQIEKANTQITRITLTDKCREAALKSGVDPSYIDDVMTLTLNRFRLGEDSKITVLDGDGDPTDKTPDDFFGQDYKKEKPRFYKGVDFGGTGSKGGAGRFEGEDISKLNSKQKIMRGLEKHRQVG